MLERDRPIDGQRPPRLGERPVHGLVAGDDTCQRARKRAASTGPRRGTADPGCSAGRLGAAGARRASPARRSTASAGRRRRRVRVRSARARRPAAAMCAATPRPARAASRWRTPSPPGCRRPAPRSDRSSSPARRASRRRARRSRRRSRLRRPRVGAPSARRSVRSSGEVGATISDGLDRCAFRRPAARRRRACRSSSSAVSSTATNAPGTACAGSSDWRWARSSAGLGAVAGDLDPRGQESRRRGE